MNGTQIASCQESESETQATMCCLVQKAQHLKRKKKDTEGDQQETGGDREVNKGHGDKRSIGACG